MPTTKFRIPATKLYLGADGAISPTVEAGEKVATLTSKDAHLLEVVYHGQALRRMVFLNESVSNLGGKDDSPIESIKGIVDGIGFATGFLDFVEKLNRWISEANGPTDPLMESLGRIHDALSRFQDFALAAWVSAREDNLALLRAHSSTAIQTANAFLQLGASRNDPVWAAKIAVAERDSLFAVNTFIDWQTGFWLRPESLAAISWAGDPTSYYRGWMPHIPDRAEVLRFKQVWDYRWALPALIYAIVARLVVLKAFAIGSKAERKLHCLEIKSYVKVLGAVFSKRWSGIRTLERLSDLQRAEYLTTGRMPMVAVDIYGGDYIGGIYFASNITPGFFAPGMAAPDMDDFRHPTRQFDLVWVEKNMRAFARHWWNVLYLRTGLEELLLFISELDVLCEQPWFPSTYVDVQKSLSFARIDDKARKDALTAVALAELVPAGSETANASRTHFLYESLRTGGERAAAIMAKCVRDLSGLVDGGAPAGKTEKRPKRKARGY